MSGVGARGGAPETYMSTWRSRWPFPLAATDERRTRAASTSAHQRSNLNVNAEPHVQATDVRVDGSAGRGRGEVLSPHPGDHPDGAIEYAPPAPCRPNRRAPPSRHRAERRKKLKKSLQYRAGGRWLRRRRLDEIMQQQAMTVGMAKPPSGRASTRPTVGLPQNLTVPRLPLVAGHVVSRAAPRAAGLR